MTQFIEAVQATQDFMREHLEVASEHVLAAERRREAQVVQPCAARFVEGELDPERKLTVARGFSAGPFGAPPSLAEKLGKKLAGASEETLERVRFAVHRAIATGYLAVEGEDRSGIAFHPERTIEDIWEYWVATCRARLEDLGVPADWARMVRHMGADFLVGELKTLRLTRYLGGSKINQLGMTYAEAGVHLRMAQTDNIPDDLFRDRVHARRRLADRPWQFGDYAVD